MLVLAVGCGQQKPPVASQPDENRSRAPEPQVMADRFEDYEAVVLETHRASLALRDKVLRETVASDSYWIKGNWGDTVWCLAALYLNEKTDAANRRLRDNARAYCDAMQSDATETAFRPEKKSGLSPWAYFALTDYVRILCLFRAGSKHHPARLQPGTEAAMKEALWWLVKTKSKVAEASLEHLLVHHGTENHDLTLRPNYYLVASLFKEDPAFRDRRYDDGHTASEHFAAYNAYFREWPRKRATVGLWFEMGSDTYQKYSYPALFNLHELSPDPVVRKRFGMFLDVAFVEEAQVSIRGRRGGGRSRAGYGKNNFESYKDLLYAPEGIRGGCTHSKVIETSQYQLPPGAILLRKMAFPAEKPFLIVNRVPGELRPGRAVIGKDDRHNSYVEDSALVNYVYRTPHYMLGSTLQNPSLSMEIDGKQVLKYSGISRQNRWCGMLFQDPDDRYPVRGALKKRADNEMCAVYPEVKKTRAGRPQHPHWSFQHQNVLLIQRIVPLQGMGSYSTGRMSIRFHGRALEKVEEDDWIFASNGKAFVAVRFLDGPHEWDETGEVAGPAQHDRTSTTRALIHSGDIDASESFDAFRASVLGNPLKIEKDRVEYRPSQGGPVLECFRYDATEYEKFRLPRVDGKEVDLRPEWTYRSPYLNGRPGDGRVTVTVGPVKSIYDFDEAE